MRHAPDPFRRFAAERVFSTPDADTSRNAADQHVALIDVEDFVDPFSRLRSAPQAGHTGMFTSAGGHRSTPPAVGSYIVTILTQRRAPVSNEPGPPAGVAGLENGVLLPFLYASRTDSIVC